ncbi:MAG TPA: hypothetical protein VFU89_03200 [Rhabdochlamydiaceae bacterium]|nr:hypothetical protein [Rhabdochlamydiaceae bacterium]
MIPLKDFCSSIIANHFALPTIPIQYSLLTSIAIAAMSRCLPAITRSEWHDDGISWYMGRWVGIKFTIIPRIALEYCLLYLLKKQGYFPCSINAALLYSAFSRIVVGTYFLEPTVRFVASSVLSEDNFKWFAGKFLDSAEQSNLRKGEGKPYIVNWKKRVILLFPILPAENIFVPLPLQGLILIGIGKLLSLAINSRP